MTKFPMRCGLCDIVVKGTWEEHLESKEHKFRVELLREKLVSNQTEYGKGHDFLRDSVKEIRENVDKPITVAFD